MSATCDSTTMELLRRVVGMRLEKVAARYPGVLAYSQVVATFADGLSIRVDLRDETVAPMFEVFVARVRPVEPPSELAEWDRLELGGPENLDSALEQINSGDAMKPEEFIRALASRMAH